MMCFAPDCKHYNEKHLCKFFKFSKELKERKRWIKLIRRADKEPNNGSSICSCHFKDGLKTNGPTIFKHNETRRLQFDFLPAQKAQKSLKPYLLRNNLQCKITPQLTANVEDIQPTASSVLTVAENMLLRKQLSEVTSKLQQLQTSFSFSGIENNDDLVVLYTGLPNKLIF